MRTVFKPFKMKKLNKKLTMLLKESLEDAPVAPIEQLKKEAAEFEKNEEARQDRGKMLARRDKLTDKADRSFFELEAAAISQHIYISDYIRGLIVSALDGKLPAPVIDSIIDEVDKLQFQITEEIEDEDEQIRTIADVLEHGYNWNNRKEQE